MLGTSVGKSDGDEDGTDDAVGPNEWNTLGALDKDGDVLGTEVDTIEGESLGVIEGTVLGIALFVTDGLWLGIKLGAGRVFGTMLGKSVGISNVDHDGTDDAVGPNDLSSLGVIDNVGEVPGSKLGKSVVKSLGTTEGEALGTTEGTVLGISLFVTG
jgi:hypothetical protein